MTTWQSAQGAFDKQLQLNLKELDNYPPHWNHFIKHIRLIEKKVGKIYDIGCGTGIYYKLCQIHFPQLKYLGVDYSPYAIQLARSQWKTEGNFANYSYKELKPDMFFSDYFPSDDITYDCLVANALCDVMEDGDECLEFLLKLNVPFVLLQRVSVTDKESYYKPYTAYGEVQTGMFYHNRENMLNMIRDNGYSVSIDLYKENIYDILLLKGQHYYG